MMKKIGLIFCFVLIVTFQEISSLSVEPWEGETLIVTVFEIQRSEVNKNFQLLVLNLNLECKQEQMNDFTILNINSICCFTRSDSIFYQEGAWVSILSCKFVTCLLHWYFLIFLISYLFVNLNPFNILWQVFPETLDGKLFTTPAVVHFAL